jgi:3-oxoacyl-[acyl-carrier-protein] synthase-3
MTNMLKGMEIGACGWGGVSVELGNKRAVGSLPDVAEKFRECKLPMSAALLGYEHFYENRLAPEESIARAVSRSLAATGVAARDVQMLIVASADVDFLADRPLLPRLLQRLGLVSALPLTITSQECTGLLSAIHLAHHYVQGQSLDNVLVVSHDRARDDAQRIQTFGVVSDAVTACLVSSTAGMEFRLKGFSHVSDLRGMQGEDDFANRKALTTAGTDAVFAGSGASVAAVKKVFGTNFFKPVAKYNATALGLQEHQLTMERALEFGHCLCADPLLNLGAYLDSGQAFDRGDLFLLQAYAPGFLASMLVECATASSSRTNPASTCIRTDGIQPEMVETEAIEHAW